MIKKLLMRLARKVLNGVLSQLKGLLSTVQDMATAPMRQMIQQVTNGVWRGNGANAFVQDVSSKMIPGVERVAATLTGMGNNLTFAQGVIDRADDEVSKIVKSKLTDVFKFF